MLKIKNNIKVNGSKIAIFGITFKANCKDLRNSKVFDLAQRTDEIGTLAQFCLQIERESIAGDDYIAREIDKGIQDVIPDESDNTGEAGKDLDDISIDDIDEIRDDIESLKNKE